jgi:hypothetical protein
MVAPQTSGAAIFFFWSGSTQTPCEPKVTAI